MRLGTTFNDLAERWAIGNLNGYFGYGTNVYGMAAGNPWATWIGADETNGFRIMYASTKRAELTAAGCVGFSQAESAIKDTLVLQRAMGWIDLSDTDTLRRDPLWQLACSDARGTIPFLSISSHSIVHIRSRSSSVFLYF